MNTELITIIFSTETAAAEHLPLLVDTLGHLNILGIVAMTRGADGRIHTLDQEAHASPNWVLQLLRFPKDYMSLLASDLVPKSSGIALLVGQEHANALLDVLSHFAGRINRYNSSLASDMQPI